MPRELDIYEAKAATRDAWLAGFHAGTIIEMLSADYTPAWLVTVVWAEYHRLEERNAPCPVYQAGDPQP